MSRVSPTSVVVRSFVLGGALLALFGAASFAQGRGGVGSRGGRSGRGGGSGGGGGGSAVTPMDRVKEELKETDELGFLENRNKQLSLDKAQKDAIKSLNKEMEQMQKPIFNDIEKTFADAQRDASQGGGFGGGGTDAGTRGGRGGMPAGVRESIVQLTDIQGAFAERADVLLKDEQKHMADSLRVLYKADLRDKAEKKSRSRSGGGFGGGRGR